MKSIFLSNTRNRRHRQAQPEQKGEEQTFFAQDSQHTQTGKSQPFFQAKLTVGKPGDPYEREADAVADTVVNHNAGQKPVVQGQGITQVGSAGSLQRLSTPDEEKMPSTNDARMEEDKAIQEKPIQKMAAPEEEEPVQMQTPEEEEEMLQSKQEEEEPVQMQTQEEEEPLQMMAAPEEEEMLQSESQPGARPATANLSSSLSQGQGNGKPLPKQVKSEMENSFGVNFTGVNIHTDTEAVQMNQELGAQAFTHGQDVYFNSGKFNPENTSGKRLLAHELTHVVQQNYSTLGRTGNTENASSESPLPVQHTTISPKMIQKTSATDSQGVTWYSTKAEAEADVPTHVSPSSCFVWNGGGPAGHQWRVIPGTGCAHWVAHELSIMGTPGCYLGFAIRVSQVTAGKTQYALANAQVGDIWTNAGGSHTGLVRTVNSDAAGNIISVQVEHCSSGQGGVVTSTFLSGLFYR